DFGSKVDVNTLEPFWTDPKSGAELCEAPTNYVLREKDGEGWKEVFKVGRLMCQKPITRDHAIQLVEKQKTELIQAFISKKGRPFDAYLLRQGAKIAWEFPPRKPREGAKNADGTPKAPRKKAPLDLSKARKLGESKVHDGELLETAESYIVAKPNADGTPRMAFGVMGGPMCGKEIPVEEVERLVETGRTGLIDGLMSKRGTTFSAYLVLSKDKKKTEFEFPPR
ncbi:MAG TPA: topoisomerase C-terminal repeat-containing protein, partial [Opitutaceae bacterium]|nr:topoisomerase C-terminal repeat-containing protein [Opitutaceae bacterium]